MAYFLAGAAVFMFGVILGASLVRASYEPKTKNEPRDPNRLMPVRDL